MNKNSIRRIVFCLAGMGLGNATRVHAVIQSLEETSKDPIHITVFTWGRAETYFNEVVKNRNIEICAIKPYLLGDEGLYSRGSVLKNALGFAVTYILNSIKIWVEVKEKNIDLAICDSDFHFLPFFLKSVPIVSISQSPVIFQEWLKRRPSKKFFLWLNFFIFECSELILLLLFAQKIFNPTLGPNKSKIKKVTSCAPIVRHEFLQERSVPDIDFMVISSGSTLYRRQMDSWSDSDTMRHLNSFPGHYGLSQNKPVISRAKAVLTQCGMSSLGECLAQKKFMFLFPVPNHPEQLINAILIEEQKMGKMISELIGPEALVLPTGNEFGTGGVMECLGAGFIAGEIIELLRSNEL